jgi:hypothetical protein
MPTYTMINKVTGERKDMILTLSEREDILASGEWTQALSTGVGFVSQHGMTVNKAGDGWKDVLKKVKSGSGRGNTVKD